MKRSSGWASWAAMSALFALSILCSVSLRARTADLALEGRSLCRVRARWAAESAIARARSSHVIGSITGVIDADSRYQLTVTRQGPETRLEARGTCQMKDRTTHVEISVQLSPEGRITRWREGP